MKRIAIALIALVALHADAQYYTSWPHDLRAVIRWSAIAPLFVEAINATQYKGRYSQNFPICSHYDLTVSADPGRTQVKDLSQLLWDNPGSSFCARLEAQLVLRAEVSGCPNLGTSVGCLATTCFSANQDLVPIFGGCRLGLLPAVGFSTNVTLPFALSGEIPFDFGTAPNAPTQISFGTFAGDGSWQDAGSRKSVNAGGRTLGLQGRPATDFDTDNANVNSDRTRGNALLASDHVIGANAFHQRASAAEVLSDVRADQPFVDTDFLGLSLSPGFFLRQYPDGTRSGLFGELLPMRVLQTQSLPNGQWVNFELFVTRGGVAFANVNDKPSIVLRLGSERPLRAWLSTQPFGDGSSLAVEKFGIEVVLHPEVADQKLRLKLDQFAVNIQFAKNLPGLRTCVLTSLLQQALSASQQEIDLAKLNGSVRVSTPDCISVGIGQVEAARGCADYQGATRGYLSNIHPGGKHVDIALDLAHPRIAITEGAFVIGIPRQ